jgi:hypothetical protein
MSLEESKLGSVPSFSAAIPEKDSPDRDCNDSPGALEALKDLGHCYTAFVSFVDDALPGEVWWLARVLQRRLQESGTVEEAAKWTILEGDARIGLEWVLREKQKPAGDGEFREQVASVEPPKADSEEHPPEAAAAPEWLDKTPERTTYNLTMYDDGVSVEDQDIYLDRAEFIALKAELARIRGYSAAPEAA